MMKLTLTIITLQLLGLVAVVVECIIPSFGIISLIAATFFLISLYMVFTGLSPQVGYILVVADIFLIPAAILFGVKAMAHSPMALNYQLKRSDGVSSQKKGLDHFIGLEGTALTDLRPSGVAIIGDERIDVVTRGEYIEKESPIQVLSVTANSVIVKLAG